MLVPKIQTSNLSCELLKKCSRWIAYAFTVNLSYPLLFSVGGINDLKILLCNAEHVSLIKIKYIFKPSTTNKFIRSQIFLLIYIQCYDWSKSDLTIIGSRWILWTTRPRLTSVTNLTLLRVNPYFVFKCCITLTLWTYLVHF
jgi:hypothetical protein